MALHEIKFRIEANSGAESIPVDWSHTGVVGSGDMEVLIRKGGTDGGIDVKIVTPVTGFDDIWERVLRKFATESNLGDVTIEINDNNATPYVAAMRLKQGVMEARAGEEK